MMKDAPLKSYISAGLASELTFSTNESGPGGLELLETPKIILEILSYKFFSLFTIWRIAKLDFLDSRDDRHLRAKAKIRPSTG